MAFGVMFHHFHDIFHGIRPGSLSAEDFDALIHELQKIYTIRDPQEFRELYLAGRLSGEDIVLTFDDTLLCQFDVALPVLESRMLSGVFNVYTSIFSGKEVKLEVYAAFRAEVFADFEDFWAAFCGVAQSLGLGQVQEWKDRVPTGWLSSKTFYSQQQRIFRFVRDVLLSQANYELIMDEMMEKNPQFNYQHVAGQLWMGVSQIHQLHSRGHSVGLHSFSHPTAIDRLPVSLQQEEYEKNFADLTHITGSEPDFMSHPCGIYSHETLQILRNLGIHIGFRADRDLRFAASSLEIGRANHVDLFKELVRR